VSNGTASTSQSDRLDELIYEKLNETNQYGPTYNLQINPTTGLVSRVNPSGGALLSTNITFRVKDCNGNSIGLPQQIPTTTTLNFGPTPVNFTTPSSVSIPCDPTYNPVYTAAYLGSSVSNPLASSYPSDFNSYASTCSSGQFGPSCHSAIILGSINGLTQGTARFFFGLNSGFGCGSNSGQLTLKCWVYYKAFSGTTWSIAIPSSGGPALNGTNIYLTAGQGSTSIFRDYNTVGEYRLMSKFVGAGCQCGSAVNNAYMDVADANYPY